MRPPRRADGGHRRCRPLAGRVEVDRQPRADRGRATSPTRRATRVRACRGRPGLRRLDHSAVSLVDRPHADHRRRHAARSTAGSSPRSSRASRTRCSSAARPRPLRRRSPSPTRRPRDVRALPRPQAVRRAHRRRASSPSDARARAARRVRQAGRQRRRLRRSGRAVVDRRRATPRGIATEHLVGAGPPRRSPSSAATPTAAALGCGRPAAARRLPSPRCATPGSRHPLATCPRRSRMPGGYGAAVELLGDRARPPDGDRRRVRRGRGRRDHRGAAARASSVPERSQRGRHRRPRVRRDVLAHDAAAAAASAGSRGGASC